MDPDEVPSQVLSVLEEKTRRRQGFQIFRAKPPHFFKKKRHKVRFPTTAEEIKILGKPKRTIKRVTLSPKALKALRAYEEYREEHPKQNRKTG